MPKSIIKQSRSISLRMTEELYTALVKKDEFAELTVSEYIRAILRKEIKEQNEIENRYGYDPARRVLPE